MVVCSLHFHWTIRSSDGLIAGLSIFAGGFLAAFTHLATVRQTLEGRHAQQGEAESPERNLVDIAVTRLLGGASLLSASTVAVLVVGTSAAANDKGEIVGAFAAATWVGATLSLILFVSAVSTLYSAYVQMNRVDPDLDGSRRS